MSRGRKVVQPILDDNPKQLREVGFGVHGQEEIAKVAVTAISCKDSYSFADGRRTVVPNGPLDRRLGPSEKAATCETCNRGLADCPGHWGYVPLAVPLFHVGFFRTIITTLQNICKCCGHVLLGEVARRALLRKLTTAGPDLRRRQEILKELNTECKKQTTCPQPTCRAPNGTVKKFGPLKIVHEPFRSKKLKEEQESYRATFQAVTAGVPGTAPYINKVLQELDPETVYQLFERIPNEDVVLLGFDADEGHPKRFLWTYLPVPPGLIRPSVVQDANTSNEDDLTIKLTEIINTNAMIRRAKRAGEAMSTYMELWDFMSLTAGLYINSEMPGIPLSMAANKGARGLSQRLKGKQGRFRGNLSGKRVDFSGRTVISPDPNLRIDQVGVPTHVAKILTYPERVTEANIEMLRQRVRNGTEKWPGANYVTEKNGLKKFLKFGNRDHLASKLRVGDTVERHLHDGDIVLFNRQPSLHKLSIMAHYAKVLPHRTFRFNECVCTPYNADFDGDEMNLHLPQTEEARAEARELMGVKHNLVTPRNGEPIIAATQDFITASYLMSRKSTFFTRHELSQFLMAMGSDIRFDLPPPAIIKPCRLWTGKQLLSLLLRPNKQCNVRVNLEAKTRDYSKIPHPDLCPKDAWLVIDNSDVMCGAWDKAVVGDGNKNSVFYVLLRDYGPERAAECMNRLAKLCARWLGTRGFSIGINDVQPSDKLTERKAQLVTDGYNRCDDLIVQAKLGKLENQPGCNIEQTLESKISGILSKIRDDAGQICMTELNKHNAPLIMSLCGSKGSKINVCQMVVCVGQQIVGGSRVGSGFEDRTLPHFHKHSKEPAAKGFVRNSFYTGLTPTEFFFHAVSGREGLVDTAVKTAETGYMQRRLMKALEDLTVHYDGTVRSATKAIVQFEYGDDSLDPTTIEGDNQPVAFHRNLQHAMNIARAKGDRALLPDEITARVLAVTSEPGWKRHLHTHGLRPDFMELDDVSVMGTGDDVQKVEFVDELRSFIEDQVVAPRRALLKSNLREYVAKVHPLTQRQLDAFLAICKRKYLNAIMEPGTAVGAVGAQSIGEPGTQMTLKTFHFAGVASMNVTLGVPRIKEIINAAKTISTPIITAKLESEKKDKNAAVTKGKGAAAANKAKVAVVGKGPAHSELAARIVKGRVEKTLLGDVTHFMEINYTEQGAHLLVEIDLATVAKLQLEVDLYTMCNAILGTKALKLTTDQIAVQPPNQIRIHAKSMRDLHQYKRLLPEVIVKGIPSVNRAVISEERGEFKLHAEGYGLRFVMNTDGVDGKETRSNHIMEVQQVLGIEAARNTIIDEIQNTMKSHGMTIDPRHVMLLGDTMTNRGEVLGITRFGVSKMKDSALMLASFEKTTDHLFDAARYAKRDPIEGVSECIIMGQPMPIGSGLFKLLQKDVVAAAPRVTPKLLFDRPEFHV
ncbi:hypothetical protein AMAG_12759 [Allomyces macrogynus ATCC 38327]|uniref:DNA-directed RNA polymerase subunit n=1 Tax=Allomyces macrogynus (strain ATCC 38327) TaxID=578462 RepID=A0A0L0T1Z4_ALLM3|nr:hypothetical protein AMAG_12759 [Allomyces macrogynus ATCC 38327]|eukprot:KNE68594.1 hypothetical protein AMAG_12759 [Allomyces macrogynus ATCC 38327]